LPVRRQRIFKFGGKFEFQFFWRENLNFQDGGRKLINYSMPENRLPENQQPFHRRNLTLLVNATSSLNDTYK